ncbi:MAG: hypothetical protein IKI31_03160, partial [Treponema sp.]|nr:hypothetical protein [Treponema sp.]
MPGLDQLKQFNSDVLALGGEAEKRASRGEQIVRVPIPRTVKPVDDSEDFVLGMPEISEEELAQREKEKNVTQDDDFSDITGEKSSSKSETQEDAEPEIQLDMSSLLTPIAEVSTEDVGVPDLSAFIEESPKVEEPPKETSIADMSLDDLLGKSDFDLEDAEPLDAYDEVIEEEPPAPPPPKEEVVVPNIPGAPILDFIEEPVSSEPKASATKIDEPAIDEPFFGDVPKFDDTDFASDIGGTDFASDVSKFDNTDFASDTGDTGNVDFASDT